MTTKVFTGYVIYNKDSSLSVSFFDSKYEADAIHQWLSSNNCGTWAAAVHDGWICQQANVRVGTTTE